MDIFNNNGIKRTDKIGPLEIDRVNRKYSVHGADKAMVIEEFNNLVKGE